MSHIETELVDLRQKEIYPDLNELDSQAKQNILRVLNVSISNTNHKANLARCYFYINPHSAFALIWGLLYMIIFYVIQMQISLSLAFGPQFFKRELNLTGEYIIAYVMIVIFLAFDIFLSFFTGYYAFGKGRVIDNFRMVVNHYLKEQFPIDAIIWIIYIIPLIHIDYELNFIQLITAILLWIKKFKYQQAIVNSLRYYQTIRITFMLFILFVDVLMIGNYGACIFVGMDLLLYNQQYFGSNTSYYWLTNNSMYPINLIGGAWYVQYVYGQAFSTGTLSTLAPGPFAKNPFQALYAIFVMIFFMILASYVGEVLIQIVYTFTEKRIFHEENIMSFDNFMQMKSVGRDIRNRIYNFFELIWQVEIKIESQQQQNMIKKLPAHLKQELLIEIGFTKSIHFISKLPHLATLSKKISLEIERVTIDNGTCLFKSYADQVQNQEHYLFYIKDGMAKFYLTHHQNQNQFNPIKQVTVNLSNVEKVLGIYEFISKQNYAFCCKSIDLCQIQRLSLTKFEAIVKQLQIWQQFKQMQASVLYERNYQLINKQCIICLQNHIESQCQVLFCTNSIKNQMVQRQQKHQKRAQFQRKRYQQKKYRNKIKKTSLSLFDAFSNIKLDKLILRINDQQESQQQVVIEAIQNYSSFFERFNLTEIVYHSNAQF